MNRRSLLSGLAACVAWPWKAKASVPYLPYTYVSECVREDHDLIDHRGIVVAFGSDRRDALMKAAKRYVRFKDRWGVVSVKHWDSPESDIRAGFGPVGVTLHLSRVPEA